MADEIVLPFRVDAHTTVGKPAPRKQLAGANAIFKPTGFFFRSGQTARLNVKLPVVPPEIHATTPNAELLIDWFTSLTDTTNAAKFFVKIYSVIPANGSYTLDPAAADFTAGLDSSVTQVSLGALKPNRATINIPTALAAAGRQLIGTVERNDADSGDTLAGAILIHEILFRADKA